MITLAAWIAESGLTHQQVADLVPCARSYITLVCNGNIRPSWRMAARIEDITNGKVSRKQWYPDKLEIG